MADKYSFIVVKYPQKDMADAALHAVLNLAKEKVVKLRDAVAITKTDKGKIKLHQTKDDSASKGLLKGGGIGVIFALLFGPAGWIVAGAALGGAFATFDRGIKNKLLKELGENMTPDQIGAGRAGGRRRLGDGAGPDGRSESEGRGHRSGIGGRASGRHREVGGCAADDRSRA